MFHLKYVPQSDLSSREEGIRVDKASIFMFNGVEAIISFSDGQSMSGRLWRCHVHLEILMTGAISRGSNGWENGTYIFSPSRQGRA